MAGQRALAEALTALQTSQERAAERQAEQLQLFSTELMRTLNAINTSSASTRTAQATTQRLVSGQINEVRGVLATQMRRDFAAREARARARFVVRLVEQESRLHTQLAQRLQAQDAQLRNEFAAFAASAPSTAPNLAAADDARTNRLNDSRLRRNLPARVAAIATETPWHHLRTGFWTNPGFRSTLFAVPKASLSALIWVLDGLAAIVAWMHATGLLSLMSLMLNWATRMPRIA